MTCDHATYVWVCVDGQVNGLRGSYAKCTVGGRRWLCPTLDFLSNGAFPTIGWPRPCVNHGCSRALTAYFRRGRRNSHATLYGAPEGAYGRPTSRGGRYVGVPRGYVACTQLHPSFDRASLHARRTDNMLASDRLQRRSSRYIWLFFFAHVVILYYCSHNRPVMTQPSMWSTASLRQHLFVYCGDRDKRPAASHVCTGDQARA